MRVISGTAKGRQLTAPEAGGTRPLTDRAREGIFSAIGGWVEDAEVLDLYAGSGSFGIEALSRGAARAVFVENAWMALEALRQNLTTVGFGDQAVIISQSVADFLKRPQGRFHLFFLDPPWSLATSIAAEQMLLAAGLGEDGAEMVIHRRYPDQLPVLPSGWHEAGIYRYGDSVLYRVAAPSFQQTAQ